MPRSADSASIQWIERRACDQSSVKSIATDPFSDRHRASNLSISSGDHYSLITSNSQPNTNGRQSRRLSKKGGASSTSSVASGTLPSGTRDTIEQRTSQRGSRVTDYDPFLDDFGVDVSVTSSDFYSLIGTEASRSLAAASLDFRQRNDSSLSDGNRDDIRFSLSTIQLGDYLHLVHSGSVSQARRTRSADVSFEADTIPLPPPASQGRQRVADNATEPSPSSSRTSDPDATTKSEGTLPTDGHFFLFKNEILIRCIAAHAFTCISIELAGGGQFKLKATNEYNDQVSALNVVQPSVVEVSSENHERGLGKGMVAFVAPSGVVVTIPAGGVAGVTIKSVEGGHAVRDRQNWGNSLEAIGNITIRTPHSTRVESIEDLTNQTLKVKLGGMGQISIRKKMVPFKVRDTPTAQSNPRRGGETTHAASPRTLISDTVVQSSGRQSDGKSPPPAYQDLPVSVPRRSDQVRRAQRVTPRK